MPMPISGTSRRKRFQITTGQLAKLETEAALSGTSLSQVVREWIERVAKTGRVPRRMPLTGSDTVTEVQVIVDPEVVAEAERKAKEAGTTLRDIVVWNIDHL
jgi:hypothetical protein